MRIATFTTLALALLAAAPAAAVVERADTVATYIGGTSAHPMSHRISGDGGRVVFEANTGLIGGDREIFVWDHATGKTQITDEASKPGPNSTGALDVDFDGTAVAAIAHGDLADTGAVISELYRWTTESGWERLTFTAGPISKVFVFDAAISDDGTRIAFASRDDYTGENPGGETQVFLWDAGAGFTQITHGFPCGPTGGNFVEDMSGDGSRVLFSSTCRYDGVNDDLGVDVFLWDETAGVRALTETKRGDTVARASLNRDGTVAAMVSGSDLTGEGVTGIRLYRWVDGDGFRVLSKAEPTSPSAPSISANGNRIVYVARNGQGTSSINPEGAPELFFWQQGLSDVAALTDSGQTDQDLGNDRPQLSADGTRLSMLAVREFDAPADLRNGHYVIDVLSPQKARPNLLVNGSFGTGFGGWILGTTAVFSPDDAKADPASGSALQPNTGATGTSDVTSISQCVPVEEQATYVLSGLLRIVPGATTGSARLAVRGYPTKDCSGPGPPPLHAAAITRDDGAWVGAHGRFATGPTIRTLEVILVARKNEPGGSLEAGFDDVNLRPVNKIILLP